MGSVASIRRDVGQGIHPSGADKIGDVSADRIASRLDGDAVSVDARPGLMQLVLSLTPGGTERLTIEIVTRLLERYRIVVCCLDQAGEWAGELTARGVPVVPLHRAPGFHPSLGARVARIAAEHRATLIHCHHYSPFVYGCIAALRDRRLGVIFTEHGRLSDAPPSMKRRIANSVLGRMPASMFAVSSALKAHMVAEGFHADRLGVIHNGIEPGPRPTLADRVEARAMLGVSAGTFLIGTAARLDPVKDLKTLIAATALVRRRVPDVQLVIVGSGDEQAALEAAAAASGLGDAVRLLGHRGDVRRLLPGLDVYVNSSVTEGISLTILEAMAAGVPVVATRVGGTPEVVVPDTTGLLVEPRDPERLAAAIVEVAEAPDRRRDWGSAGRLRVETLFTMDRMVADYAREYTRLGCS
jgi:glycosyltransferase involved in cell wall biosynthesis